MANISNFATFVSAIVCHVAWQTSSCRRNLMRRGFGFGYGDTDTDSDSELQRLAVWAGSLESGISGARAINFHAHCHCRVRSVFTLYDVWGEAIPHKEPPPCSSVSYFWTTDLTERILTE